MHAAKALRVRALLLRIIDRRDPLFERLDDRIRLFAEHALLRVLEEVAHGHAHALHDLGQVRLHLETALGPRDELAANGCAPRLRPAARASYAALHLALSYACCGDALVPPAA